MAVWAGVKPLWASKVACWVAVMAHWSRRCTRRAWGRIAGLGVKGRQVALDASTDALDILAQAQVVEVVPVGERLGSQRSCWRAVQRVKLAGDGCQLGALDGRGSQRCGRLQGFGWGEAEPQSHPYCLGSRLIMMSSTGCWGGADHPLTSGPAAAFRPAAHDSVLMLI